MATARAPPAPTRSTPCRYPTSQRPSGPRPRRVPAVEAAGELFVVLGVLGLAGSFGYLVRTLQGRPTPIEHPWAPGFPSSSRWCTGRHRDGRPGPRGPGARRVREPAGAVARRPVRPAATGATRPLVIAVLGLHAVEYVDVGHRIGPVAAATEATVPPGAPLVYPAVPSRHGCAPSSGPTGPARAG